MKRIAVLGNSCAGKTTLSRKIQEQTGLPLYHVDSYQFDSQLNIRPYKETIEVLKKIQAQEVWIIDGYGPLDLLIDRMRLADEIVFLDFPLWRHYYWFFKRQFYSLFRRRSELPKGVSELSFAHLIKGLRGIKKVHLQMRPELLRILQRAELQNKVKIITELDQYKRYEAGAIDISRSFTKQ